MDKFIKNLAKGAGAILREGFKKEYTFRLKSEHRWNIVTNYDLAADKYIIEKIQKRYPNHGILTEESGHVSRKRNFWIVDPLDGTHAFCKGWDQFCTSISFVSNNALKLGAVYDPIRDELFFAGKGKGAFLNGRRIIVSNTSQIEFCTTAIILGSGSTTFKERKVIYNNAIRHAVWFAKLDSAALTGTYVARGIFDIYITKNLSPWDYSACGLIMAEAGAKVTDFQGRPYRWDKNQIVAANPLLHKQALSLVKELK